MTGPSSVRRLALDRPLDLGHTLLLGDLGRANPTLRRPSPGELLRAQWTPDGAVSFRLALVSGAVEAEAWGPGRRWLLDELPRHLGLDDRAPAFEGKLGRVQRRLPGVRRGRTLDVFDLLVGCVIRQRVAWRDAVTSQVEMLRAHGSPAPGPLDLRLPLSAAQWGTLTSADLAGFGLDRKRAKTALGLAARADRIRGWASLPHETFAARLEAFPGVGPWTRAMVQGHGLQHHDAVPLGDYVLPSMISWFFAREPRGDDARMVELLEPYRGQRFRVIHLLWAAGVHAPRFGPRIRGVRP
ncbi:3-methyl-adenine DNA glycosylase II [Enhygromyxa salina]|uniref:3-methyl-adenine DNA glycosylase II n=1 Tax=Enhygromyxa salina TaxID=215803 RepID=A0A2S9XX92_9BACT|nr:3-methyladenine DNA glycosylase [Enhygromyxa salina]PRP97488.1 3-methyl-adenine DNA glycosylase II [Enhygromyxa salina]